MKGQKSEGTNIKHIRHRAAATFIKPHTRLYKSIKTSPRHTWRRITTWILVVLNRILESNEKQFSLTRAIVLWWKRGRSGSYAVETLLSFSVWFVRHEFIRNDRGDKIGWKATQYAYFRHIIVWSFWLTLCLHYTNRIYDQCCVCSHFNVIIQNFAKQSSPWPSPFSYFIYPFLTNFTPQNDENYRWKLVANEKIVIMSRCQKYKFTLSLV